MNRAPRSSIVVLALAMSISVLALLFTAVPASAHDAPNRCGGKAGEGAGWFKVRGHNVGCEKARRVARRWEDKCVEQSGCPRRRPAEINVDPGFSCGYEDAGLETVRVRCTAPGDRIVHFYWGS